jgi:predicted Rossmann fold flavoprotein
MTKTSIILGGGAAGFFAAVNTARLNPDQRVIILEKSNKLLAKVRVSGGGRCNVTHACFDAGLLSKNYPRGEKALRQAFARFAATDTVVWFSERGVQLKTEADGRMFPVTDNSQTIIDCLLREAEKYNVEIRLQTEVTGITREDELFVLQLADGKAMQCNNLLMATGGHPKAAGYDLLRSLGHRIAEPVPSLFTFNMPGDPVRELMGVSVEKALVKIPGLKAGQEGPLLITHWGMSGPAILKSSAWGARVLNDAGYRFDARVTWVQGQSEQQWRDALNRFREQEKHKQVSNANPFPIPKRLWDFFTWRAGMDAGLRWADVSNKQLNRLLEMLLNDTYRVEGKTTFKEEFVTCGGVELNEVDFKTMESRVVPHLYFAGEVLDIDGVTGGFNFQAAWTTGMIAAHAMANA